MTLTVQAEVKVTGAGARAELDKVKASTEGMAGSGKKASGDLAALRREVALLKQTLAAQDAELKTLRTSLQAYETKVATVGRTHVLAAGQVGNLTSQFNDIGIMLAAGQNPLQLAIQQGTQITQVIGPLGAAGAVRALGTAFMGLLSPVNLVTLGVIAGGATLVQWLSSGKEEAESLEDALDRLKEASGRLAASDGLAAAPRSAISEYQNLIAVIQEVDRIERQRAAEAVVRATGLGEAIARSLTANSIAAQIGNDPIDSDFMGLDSINEANFLLERTRELMGAAREEQAGMLDGMVESLSLRGILTAEVQEYVAQLAGQLGLTDKLVENERTRAVEAKNATSAAIEMRLHLAEVARAGESTRAALEALPGALSGSASIALSLANELWRAADGMARLVAIGQPVAQGGRGGDPRQFTYTDEFRAQLQAQDSWKPPRSIGGGRSGGGIDAVAALIAREQERLAILRETDPVQKEILRNSRALAEATAAERAAVEELIATRVGEEAQLQTLRESQEFFSDALYDSLEGLILKGESLSDVMGNLAEMIARAALQATILGTGPLAGLLGGGSGGGLLGDLVGAILPKKAAGGMITGPGTGTSDEVPILASNGEFVMNARSTARYRHVLEAMNAGALPGFAHGGMVGGAPAAAPGGQVHVMEATITVVGARGNAEIEQMVYAGTQKVLREYDREVLPVRFKQISANGRRIG